ncbi:MAG: cytochrome c3 family protein [Bacteroidia bacterium]
MKNPLQPTGSVQAKWLLPVALVCTVVFLRCGTATPRAFASLDPDTDYVGSQSCQPCHQKVFESYFETGMGRSLHEPDPGNIIEAFGDEAIVFDQYSDFYYEPFWKNKKMYIREFRLAEGDTVHNRVEEVSYVVGSGHQTRSYLMQRNGYLYEMPITWYVSKKLWDLSPGYHDDNNSRFSREIGAECMACHTGNFDIAEGSKNRFSSMSLGIDCEQCHGPGEAHVKATAAGQLIDVGVETDYTIVNPAKLPTNLQFDVCQQCHLQGTNALADRGSVRDFRPGMALSEVFHVFLEQPKHPEAFGIASHAERLQQSECFIQSEGKLTCTTCHDPHKSINVTAQNVYIKQCESCHSDAMIPDCGENEAVLSAANGDCISCHMPQRGTRDIPHVFFHDHKIRVVQDSDTLSVEALTALTDRLHCATGQPSDDAHGRALLRYFEEQRSKPVFLQRADSLLAPSSRYQRARLAMRQGNLVQARALVKARATGISQTGWSFICYSVGS